MAESDATVHLGKYAKAKAVRQLSAKAIRRGLLAVTIMLPGKSKLQKDKQVKLYLREAEIQTLMSAIEKT